MTGYGFDQVIGMKLKDIVPEFEFSFKYIDKAITECSTQTINNFRICSYGEYKYFDLTISPVVLNDGVLSFLVNYE